MKNQYYRGWKIYKAKSGSNQRLISIFARTPSRESCIEKVLNTPKTQKVVSEIKKEIDALESKK